MSFRIARTIFFKELLDTLRDKRTLIAMIGVPVILYPAMLVIGSQVVMVQQSQLEERVSEVVLVPADNPRARGWLEAIERVEIAESDDPDAALSAGDIDAILRVPEDIDGQLGADASATVTIAYDATEGDSREAARRIEDALEEHGEALLDGRLEAQGLERAFARPLVVARDNVAPIEKTTGSLLGSILPLLMVVMLGVGAFYPAIDLTAGEKERGTFETLLSTPASKLEIVLGKFLAVFTLSMLTGILNLGSMTITLAFQYSQFVNQLGEGSGLEDLDLLSIAPTAAGAMILVLIPLAFFISAVMLTVSLFARTFKDAQNLVTPFFIAIIMPAMLGALPDVKLSAATQFIPVGNVTLLFRELMKGTVGIDMVFTVFICTAVYALLALTIATWLFQREEVILSEEKGVPVTFRRDQFRPRTIPTPGMAFGLFGIVMLLIFYAGAFAQSKDIHYGLLITQYALIFAPVVGILWFAKVDLRSALNLRVPRFGAFVGTLILAPAWVVIVMQISIWQSLILPPPEGMDAIEQLLFGGADNPVNLYFLLFVVAVSPAICEELLFRGALVSGLKDRMPAWAIVLTVGIAFGLFHLSVYRFVPTALSGLVLTYLAVRTGSIYPTMLLHLVMNGTLIVLGSGNAPERVETFLTEMQASGSGFPWWILVSAAAVAIAGLIVVGRAKPDSGLRA